MAKRWPQSKYTTIAGKHVSTLLLRGFYREACDAMRVVEALERRRPSRRLSRAQRVQQTERAMLLEGAKILVEEGDPQAAVELIQQVIAQATPLARGDRHVRNRRVCRK